MSFSRYSAYFLGFMTICSGILAHEITFENTCPDEIYVGALANGGMSFLPANGGFRLASNESRTITFPRAWGGRFWARTGCTLGADNVTLQCETGDCGRRLECGGIGGDVTVTLAEITFDGWQSQDFYDVSNVDAFNIPITMYAKNGTFVPNGGEYNCGVAGVCKSDFLKSCPSALRILNSNGTIVACQAPCKYYTINQNLISNAQRDAYCCDGACNDPHKCGHAEFGCGWEANASYPTASKAACPGSYSYPYDDTTSTWTCQNPNGETAYVVSFCSMN
eukprot:TRINITY_DN5312_c0_g1_i1.p1 TRINITY_DN5312_c0_g1~~TRINITY_DN5312_c0_g1_i1.p1  ORF type:complete len:279 (-),score=35.85 TRINITY_DN5312_c0_g1_i1:237-1073(-)